MRHALDAIVLLSDGIRGHLSQSRGVAHWLSRAAGVPVFEMDVPLFRGVRRLWVLKVAPHFFAWRRTPDARKKSACAWLHLAGVLSGGELFSPEFLEAVRRRLKEGGGELLREANGSKESTNEMDVKGGDGVMASLPSPAGRPSKRLLFLSAGSAAAPFCLALARSCETFFPGAEGIACTLMTPSGLGIAPFDVAIVPEHDLSGVPPRFGLPGDASKEKNGPFLCVTLGAPNAVVPESLKDASKELLRRFPPSLPEAPRWGILLGGDDGNYRISASWVRNTLGALFERAQREKATLYVTTSRRTSREAEKALTQLAEAYAPTISMLFLASKDPWNPVPGMLGAVQRVFCTEDSVSMVSEAATAGHRVVLLRVERRKGLVAFLNGLRNLLARSGIGVALAGTARFDALFRRMEEENLLVLFPSETDAREAFGRTGASEDWLRTAFCPEPKEFTPEGQWSGGFNEARRAAELLLVYLTEKEEKDHA